jgi:hypothetical protein
VRKHGNRGNQIDSKRKGEVQEGKEEGEKENGEESLSASTKNAQRHTDNFLVTVHPGATPS